MKSPKFEFAAFKGVGLSVRDWNGQVRQPMLVATPKLLVSVSPQPGFLHQFERARHARHRQARNEMQGLHAMTARQRGKGRVTAKIVLRRTLPNAL